MRGGTQTLLRFGLTSFTVAWVLILVSCRGTEGNNPVRDETPKDGGTSEATSVKLDDNSSAPTSPATSSSPPRPVGSRPTGYKKSIALLIGISNYDHWPTPKRGINDIDKVAELFRNHGFIVETSQNPNGRDLRAAVNGFIDLYGDNEEHRLLFFFSGHGYTRKGKSYLVPADAPDPKRNLNALLGEALPIHQMISVKANHVLMLFDSCVSEDGFSGQVLTEPPPPLSPLAGYRVRQMVSPCGADQQLPGPSPFVSSLVWGLKGLADVNKDGYVTGHELGTHVHKSMLNKSKKYTPQYGKLQSSHQSGEFAFNMKAFSDRVEWQQRLSKMEKEMEDLESRLMAQNLSASRKASAWRKFLDTFEKNNPFSEKDDALRRQATDRFNKWNLIAEKSPTSKDNEASQGDSEEVAQSSGGNGTRDDQESAGLGERPGHDNELDVLRDSNSKLLRKVVGLSDNISIVEVPPSSKNVTMEYLRPYFILQDLGDRYLVSTLQEEGGFRGFVVKEEVAEWNTREGLHFIASTFDRERRASVEAWSTEQEIRQFSLTLDAKAYGPTFREELQTRVGNRSIIPYPLLDTKEIEDLNGKTIRIHQVLVPATVAGSVETDLTPEEARNVAGAVTICVVFDASRSMRAYAKNFVSTVGDMLSNLDSNTRISVGFILFRKLNRKADRRFEIFHPRPANEALKWFRKRMRFTFGGDDPQEPVLDAMTLAKESFLWNGGTAIRGASRIAILVANRDAKVQTAGLTDNVKTGLTAEDVASNLLDARISVYALQAGNEDRGHLVEVLRTLAVDTGGEFYRSAIRSEEIKAKFAGKLRTILRKSIEEGDRAVESLEDHVSPREGGGTVIALDPIDPGTRQRLRSAAAEFHVADGGLVTTKAWVFEVPDLYSEKILIDKKLLEWLVRFFNTVTDSTLDAKSLRESTANLLSVLTGESVRPNVEVQDLIEKKTGIHFTTNILSFDLDFLANLNDKEKELLQERIRRATEALVDFLEINALEFNEEHRVWMPVSYLP